MRTINLIPVDRVRTSERRDRIRRWTTIVCGYAGITALACLVAHVPLAQHSPQAKIELERLAARAAKAADDRARLHERLVAQRRALENAKAVGEHPDWSILLESIARIRSDRAAVESLTLTAAPLDQKPPTAPAASQAPEAKAKPRKGTAYTLKLTGFVTGPGEVFDFARAVEQLKVFDEVRVKDSRSATLGVMPATRFEIEAVATEFKEEIP